MIYPKSKKISQTDVLFGISVEDPYRWMENEQDPALATWIQEQNQTTNKYLQSLPNRSEIKERLKTLHHFDRFTSMMTVGDSLIYALKSGLQNQPVYYIDRPDQSPMVLIDPNERSIDGTVAVTLGNASHEHRYVSFFESHSGSDWQTIYIIDLQTGTQLKDHIEWVKYTNIAWKGTGFYYSGYEKPHEGKELSEKNSDLRVYYHALGTEQSEDQLIFEDSKHPLRYHTLMISEDEQHLILQSSEGTYGSEIQYRSVEEDQFQIIFPGFDYNYDFIGSSGDVLYFQTNDHANLNKVMAYHTKKGNQENILEGNNRILEQSDVINHQLITLWSKDVSSQLEIYTLDGTLCTEIQLPGKGSVYQFDANDRLYYSYGSFTIPTTFYVADIKTGISSVYKQSQCSFDSNQFITEQIFCPSKDGTQIPVFLTYHKELKKNGHNPTLLYAYGGFSISLPPAFNPSIIYFLEQGGIYAQASLRGGFEYGESWHKGGMLLQKQNVFDDFIGVAETLIEKKYTSPQHLGIQGGSNGGLLMGAVLNQRPDLFAVAFPQVGVMDMIRYHKFTIGWGWTVEYGSPDEEQHFHNIFHYSPLHNITEKPYPAVMVMTADHDDRVVPAHSFKYIATLQEKNTSDHPTLIRIESKAGHGAGKSTEKLIQEHSDMFAMLQHHTTS